MSIHEIKVEPKPGDSGFPEPVVYEHAIPDADIDSDAAKVIRRLVRHGHLAYLVGGGVRDLLLGASPKDFDVATSARPGEVRSLFRNCRIIGRRFRLAHILFSGGKIIETATFRRDPTDGDGDRGVLIRRDNEFGEPHEDAIRRDFTINGLFYDLSHGEVIDYVGGVPDLEKGILRMIGDPNYRLAEDPVRILRAIKFSARLDLGIDPELYDAMMAHRDTLRNAAAPRLLEETLRLLRGGACHRSFYLMWDCGALALVLPEVASLIDEGIPELDLHWRRLQMVDKRIRDGEELSDAVMLAALLYASVNEMLVEVKDPSRAFEDYFEEISVRLSVPRRLKDRIRSICVAQRRLESGKLGALPQREFFDDATDLFAINLEAKGEIKPDWMTDPEKLEAMASRRPRRRRRRRRRTDR